MSVQLTALLRSLAVPFLLGASACTSAYAEQPKQTIEVESYMIAPRSLDELWDSSTIIAKVVVEKREVFGVPSPTGSPRVYTRYFGRVVRVFKGEQRTGSRIDFASTGGVLETPNYIVRQVSHAEFLEVGRTYIVFIKPFEQTGLLLDFNHFGAFEVARSRIAPVGGGEVSEEWRDKSEKRFTDALDRLGIRRGGTVK